MSYKIEFKKQAFKSLEKIRDPFYSKIKKAIYNLVDNPRPPGYKKLVDRPGYRIRVGNYRIIYDIFDEQLVIELIAIGDRKDVYD